MFHLSKTVKLFLILLVVSASLSISYIGKSKATDQTVQCDQSGCSGTSGALFTENNLSPLSTITQTVSATNNYPETRQFAVQISNSNFSLQTPKLSQVLTVKIIPQGSSTPIYGPVTLDQWLQDDFVLLTSIASGQTQKYEFIVTLANVGNNYQAKNIQFDLSIGFDALPPDQPPTQNPPSNPDTGGPSNPSTPTCTASPPNIAPQLTALIAGPNEVLLQWSPISPTTHYMVQYGTGDSWLYGNPNVGNTTSYVVGSLSGNTLYNFRVVAVNDCAPGPWSNSTITQATGAVLAAQILPPEFSPILGIQDEATPGAVIAVASPEPTVLGANDTCESTFPWWLPLIIQFFLGLIIFIRLRHPLWTFLGITVLAIISQIVHNWTGCVCNPSFWCRQYIWINLAGSLIIFLLHKATSTQSKQA